MRLSKAWGIAWAGVGASLVACLAGAGLDAAISSPRFSFTVAFGLLTTAFVGGSAYLPSSFATRGRSTGIMALATLGWLPAIFFGIGLSKHAIVQCHWMCGTGQTVAILASPILLGFVLGGSTLVATALRTKLFDGLVRWLAVAAVLLAAGATSFALPRAGRPDADTYLGKMPMGTLTLALGETLSLGGKTVRYVERPNASGNTGERTCALDGVEGSERTVAASCPALSVRHDVTSDVWIVDGTERGFAFRSGRLLAGDLWPSDVAASIAPPLGWLAGGVLGVTVGLFFLVAAERARRGARAAGLLEGIHRGEGWTLLLEGPLVHVPGAASLPVGPVLLRASGGGVPTYRASGAKSVEVVRSGTLEAWREELAGRAASLAACALMSVVLTASPLILFANG